MVTSGDPEPRPASVPAPPQGTSELQASPSPRHHQKPRASHLRQESADQVAPDPEEEDRLDMIPMVPIQWVAAMRKLNPRKPNKRSSESGENQRESARVIPDARNGNLRRSRTKACFCTSSSSGNIRAPGSTISKTSSEAQSFPSSTKISGPSSTRPRSDIGETDHPPGSGSPPSSG
ncbi:hypothetical protein F2Q69_00042255 [Brassica cretica]|uniref:Uncharacterized protein n=1 Tax=Brassica cretica TaxID=69181 RepID=A0A8S9NC37_BRACR|nr:hypothetical protein F2Q69_00042255 [Brassica cretica]